MGFPPQFAEGLVSAITLHVQVYQFYKKYQDEHEKKFPPKGAELKARWDAAKKKEQDTKTKEQEETKDDPKDAKIEVA